MEQAKTQAKGRGARYGLTFLAWGVVYTAARLGVEAVPRGSAWSVVLALMPLPFFVLVLWSLRGHAASLDELQLRIQMEAVAVAFPLALMLIMVLGLLQLAIDLNPADWSYRHIWPFFIAFYALGLWLAGRRYQ